MIVHPLITRLVEARQAQGLTQAALAQKLRITQPALSLREWGHNDVSLSNLTRWADALGLELDFTVFGREPS